MTVSFELPNDIEQALRDSLPDVGAAAKEAALVGFYRQGRIGPADLRRALGLSRLEVEEVLKRHGVTEDLPTADEHDAALARLRQP